jgi:methionine-rich copper-binding protein CopC
MEGISAFGIKAAHPLLNSKINEVDCGHITQQTQQTTMEQQPENDLKSGPFSVLYKAVKGNTQVLINVRNNHKLLGRVKAYDRHMNL